MHYGRCASGVFKILRGANKVYCGQGDMQLVNRRLTMSQIGSSQVG